MSDAKEKQKKILQRIKEFRLFDDRFMSRVFDENIECTELVLHIILDRPDIRMTAVHTQREIKNLRGHSVRLDINAESTDGEPIDVEIQRADKGAEVKRARYNSSLMDANTLIPGEGYDKLPESYVIFITENDVMGAGLPIYHADRVISETGKPLEDGAHIIYVNGAYQDDSPLGKLMHDFSCRNPDDMYYQQLAKQVQYYKKDAKGVEVMKRDIEDWMVEFVDEYIDDDRKESALLMLEGGELSKEKIAKYLKLEIEVVNALDEERKMVTY